MLVVMHCDYTVFMALSFFFFKQKTAYEMRISDWSSDVCSSDLTYSQTEQTPRDESEKNLVHFAYDVVERRSEEHTSELQSLMRISYAVFCLKKKTKYNKDKQSVVIMNKQTIIQRSTHRQTKKSIKKNNKNMYIQMTTNPS